MRGNSGKRTVGPIRDGCEQKRVVTTSGRGGCPMVSNDRRWLRPVAAVGELYAWSCAREALRRSQRRLSMAKIVGPMVSTEGSHSGGDEGQGWPRLCTSEREKKGGGRRRKRKKNKEEEKKKG